MAFVSKDRVAIASHGRFVISQVAGSLIIRGIDPESYVIAGGGLMNIIVEGGAAAGYVVLFDATGGTVISESASLVVVRIPAALVSGAVTLSVTDGDANTDSVTFTYTDPAAPAGPTGGALSYYYNNINDRDGQEVFPGI